MTTVSPHGLQILESNGSRRAADGRMPVRVHASARVADRRAMRGVAAMNLEILLLMAFVAALVGAVLPS